MWTDMAPLCEDMDAHQKPGDPKADDLLVKENSFQFAARKPAQVVAGLPTPAVPEHETRANDDFRAKHPEAPFQAARQCRRAMSYTIEGNTVTP
jgi:hypothetical protein